MVNRTPQPPTQPALREALAAAVRAGDRSGAMQLEQAICIFFNGLDRVSTYVM